MSVIRIGAGAGFQGDRLPPAVDLAERGKLDYLVFECLGERTIALAQQARSKDPSGGFDPLLERRMRAVMPACDHGLPLAAHAAKNPLRKEIVKLAQQLNAIGADDAEAA